MDTTLLIIISTISGLVLGWLGIHLNSKKATKDEYREQADQDKIIIKMDTKLDFIQNDIKDIKAENKLLNKDVSEIKSELTIVKNSVEKAHSRIDDIKKKGSEN